MFNARILLSFLLLLLAVSTAPVKCDAEEQLKQTGPDESRLRDDLLKGYDRETTPGSFAKNDSTTTVYMDMYVIHVSACSRAMVAKIGGWLAMVWSDPRLGWSPADYGNIKQIRMPVAHLWSPDILPYNMYPSISKEWITETMAVIYNNGTVIYVPPVSTAVPCNFNVTEERTATLQCPIKLGSWTYSEDLVDLMITENREVNSDYYHPTGKWIMNRSTIERNSKVYPCCPEKYVSVNINLFLEHRHRISTYMD